MWRLVVLAGLVAGAAGFVLAARPGPSAERQVLVRPSVTSKLPAWVAPGVRVTVEGFAGSAEPVRLLLAGRPVATATSGRLGRFQLRFAAARPGAYAVAVASAGGRVRVGRILVRPVTLAAVGDVTTGESVGTSVDRLGAAYAWQSVGKTLRAADIATANLEGVVSFRGSPVPDKEFHFNGPPAMLKAMHGDGGLDVVTVANNHSGDYGPQALMDTMRFARAAGLKTIGGGADEQAALRPVVMVAGGLRIAFVGLSDVNPYGFNAGPATPGTARADPDTVAAAVRAARRRADVVVCWFHWGTELVAEPSERQRDLAAAALAAGAQVVLGAHPHVFGRVVSRSHRLVAWTLGNFVFPAHSPQTVHTGILELKLDRSGVRAWHVVPAHIVGFQPQLSPS
jgi:proteasome lid subunit RPN8/RPN11